MDGSAVMQVDDGDEDVPNRDLLLLIVFYTLMSLKLAPYSCKCGKHEVDSLVWDLNSHKLSERCPYAEEGFPPVRMGSCCSLFVDGVVRLLEEHGEHHAVQRMNQAMNCEGAAVFSTELSAIGERLMTEYLSTRTTDPDRRIIRDQTSGLTAYPLVEDLHLVFGVNPILEAARWYELTAELHYGVVADRLFE